MTQSKKHSQKRIKTGRVTAWITPELKNKVDQVVRTVRRQEGDYTTADLVRDAIRTLLDGEEEVLGSKAHQVRTFKKHANRLEAHLNLLEQRLTLLNSVTLQLLAIVSAVQLQSSQRSDVEPQKLIDLAIKAAVGEKGLATQDQILVLAATLAAQAKTPDRK